MKLEVQNKQKKIEDRSKISTKSTIPIHFEDGTAQQKTAPETHNPNHQICKKLFQSFELWKSSTKFEEPDGKRRVEIGRRKVN